MKTHFCLWLLTAGLAILGGGCDTTKAKAKQLARVAKDWSLVIRASQVIPTYPLTEDLQPGDIFLVQTPEEDQIKLYEAKGFLPLDQLVARIQPTNYQAFYLGSYSIGNHTNTPYHWKFPVPPDTNGIAFAPRAAFPSYNFSVQRGAGINLALPLQGVPVGLNVLGAASAQGSIAITDAYTFGVDSDSLLRQVQVWARQERVDRFASAGRTNYLRVVNRVFLAGRVNVSMTSDNTAGASASGGAPKPVALLTTSTNDAAGNYTNVLAALNTSVDGALPGGSLKFAAATSRSVTMVETFPRPLVIGYLSIDLPIFPNGRLGIPVPTHTKINRRPINMPQATVQSDGNAITK
jgi:hypothetical protein